MGKAWGKVQEQKYWGLQGSDSVVMGEWSRRGTQIRLSAAVCVTPRRCAGAQGQIQQQRLYAHACARPGITVREEHVLPDSLAA